MRSRAQPLYAVVSAFWCHPTHKPFLRHAGHQFTGLIEDGAAIEPTPLAAKRAVQRVEMPFVKFERPVQPHGMIKAGRHELGVGPVQAMRAKAGAEQAHIRGIGQQAVVQAGRRINRSGDAEPDMVDVAGWFGTEQVGWVDFTNLDRDRADIVFPHVFRQLVDDLEATGPSGHQILRSFHVRHGVGMFPTILIDLEAGGHIEDLLAMLDRDDPAGGKAAAIAGVVDLIDDRHFRIAWPDEIGVERMAKTVFGDRAIRRHERLGDNLATKHALAGAFIRAFTAKQVMF